jgi:hypothetical protein
MLARARLWTWIGYLFIPLAAAWAVYVRNGLADRPPPIDVLISRAYWGLLVTLIAGGALIWTAAFYAKLAKRKHAPGVVPPNTTFEDENARSPVISWTTAAIFSVAICVALAVFGVRYLESSIHKWDDVRPLRNGFWESRLEAHHLGCAKQPCFSVGPRMDVGNNIIFGVNEYILYVTDGAIVLCLLFVLAGVVQLIKAIWYKPPALLFEL